jgi:hypothetical protein
MERALQFRAAGAEDRFYDIGFRAMQADPIGEVTGLYAWLGVPVGEEFEARMRSWWTLAHHNDDMYSMQALKKRDAQLPRAAAGRRALQVGWRGNVRHAGTLQPA